MSVYTDLLFMHGHIANVELARQLAGEDTVLPIEETAVGAGKLLSDEPGTEQAGNEALAQQHRKALSSTSTYNPSFQTCE